MKDNGGTKANVRPLALEQLEERVAPAGNIVAGVVGGYLVVGGDADANDFVISQTGQNQLLIASGDDATTINGLADAQTFDNVTKGIKVSLGDGDDTIVVNDLIIDGGIAIAGGNGDKTEVINGDSEIGGAVSIKNGDGNDAVILDGTFDKGIAIDLHDGTGNVIATGYVYGAFSVKGSDGNQSFIADSLRVYGKVSLAYGDGDTQIVFNDGHVYDKTSVTTKAGSHVFVWDGGNCSKGLSISNGDGDTSVNLSNFAHVGNMSIKNGAGMDTFISNITEDANGSWKISNGEGDSHTVINDSYSVGGLSISSKTGLDTLQIGNSKFTGMVSVSAGDGDTTTMITGSLLGVTWVGPEIAKGGLTYKAGTGTHTGNFIGCTFGKAASLSMGDFSQIAMLDSTLLGSLSVKAGNLNDIFVMDGIEVLGKTSLSLGNGDNAVLVSDSSFASTTSIKTGLGTDTINIATQAGGGVCDFVGPVSVLTGAGDDLVGVGGGAGDYGNFHSRVLVDGGTGNDTVIRSDTNLFAIDPVIKAEVQP